MPVAHGWKGLSLNVSAVDLAGRQGLGFELAGNAFQVKDKDARKLA